MVTVTPLGPSDEARWDAFLSEHGGGLLYHSIPYRDLLVDHLACEAEYLVASSDGDLLGVMPIMWADGGDGRVANSLPFYGSHGGPVASSSDAEAALIAAW